MPDLAGYRPEEVGAKVKFVDLGDGSFGIALGIKASSGAVHGANGQVTAGVDSGPLVAARPTRRSVVIVNTDLSKTAYIGFGTVTAGSGLPLKAGQSVSIDSVAQINCIRASDDVVLAYMETYD